VRASVSTWRTLRDGKVHAVRGRRVVLACYNSLIPRSFPTCPLHRSGAAYS